MNKKIQSLIKKIPHKETLFILIGIAIISYLLFINTATEDTNIVTPITTVNDTNIVDSEEISTIPPSSVRYVEGTGDWIFIEYMNLECTSCAGQHERINTLQDEFTNRIRFGIKHFPINTQKTSKDRAVAAECAGSQGQFIPFIEKAFALEDKKKDPTEDMKKIAEEIGLDMDAFTSCTANETTLDIVANDAIEALGTRAQGVPHAVLIDETGSIIATFEGALNTTQLRNQLNRFWDERN